MIVDREFQRVVVGACVLIGAWSTFVVTKIIDGDSVFLFLGGMTGVVVYDVAACWLAERKRGMR